MKSPKWRLPSSSFAILGNVREFFEYLKAIRRKQIPRIRLMFTTFETRTFPMDTPTFSGSSTANIATHSSGKDVEKATSMKPTVVFPKPEALATFKEFV